MSRSSLRTLANGRELVELAAELAKYGSLATGCAVTGSGCTSCTSFFDRSWTLLCLRRNRPRSFAPTISFRPAHISDAFKFDRAFLFMEGMGRSIFDCGATK